MADGRMLSRSLSRSRQIARLHPLSAMLFAYLVPHQDSFGRLNGDPEMVKVEAVPLLPYFTPDVIAACLAELSSCRDGKGEPLVWWYEVAGERVLEFPGFLRHNWLPKNKTAKRSRFESHTADGVRPCRPRVVQLPPWQDLVGSTPGARQEGARRATGGVPRKKEGTKELPSPSSSDFQPTASAAPGGAAAVAEPLTTLVHQVAHRMQPDRIAS